MSPGLLAALRRWARNQRPLVLDGNATRAVCVVHGGSWPNVLGDMIWIRALEREADELDGEMERARVGLGDLSSGWAADAVDELAELLFGESDLPPLTDDF